MVQRLVHKFNLYEWMMEVGECLRLSTPVTIWIGFSLIVKDELNQRFYIYAIRQLSSWNFKFTSREQFNFLVKDTFKEISLHDLLHQTYISTKDDNPFFKSGFRPYKLVCNYLWIRK